MTISKILVAIICSVWFIPVSCSMGLYAGTHILSYSDSRDAQKGEQLHPLAYFVFKDSKDKDKFNYSLFKDLQQINVSSSGYSFVMEPNADSMKSGKYNSISYNVISAKDSEQIIETVFNDNDKTVWFTYRATLTDIEPISSKMMYFGYLFKAFPFALMFALLHFFGGRFLRKKNIAFRAT